MGGSPQPVIVAGGGLAGAAMAAVLADRGLSVVVFEPRAVTPDLGVETFAPGICRVLTQLGVSVDNRFVRARGAVLGWGNGEPPWLNAATTEPAVGHRFHAGYREFVDLLLSRATDFGAQVVRGAEVTGPMLEGSRVVGVRVQQGGITRTFSTSLVVDASGPARVIAHHFSPMQELPVAYTLTRTVVEDDPAADPGVFALTKLAEQGQWRWTISGSSDTVELATSVVGNGADSRDSAGYWRTYRCRRLAGDGWISVGDAAGRVDPVFLDPASIAVLAAHAAADAAELLMGAERMSYLAHFTAGYRRILDCAEKFASHCLDPARQTERSDALRRGLTGLIAEASGGTLAAVYRSLAGVCPLFDIEYPDGPLITSLAIT